MQVQSAVNIFDPLNHLICQHEHRLKTESALAFAEKLLQRGPKGVHDHNIAFLVLSEPIDLRYTDAILQDFIHFLLVEQLALRGWYRYFLGGNLIELIFLVGFSVLQMFYFHGISEFFWILVWVFGSSY